MSFTKVIFSYAAQSDFMDAECARWSSSLPSGLETANEAYEALSFGMFESDVFFDWQSLRKVSGTRLVGNRVLNDRWQDLYQEALEAAQVVAIFYSFQFEESKWCMDEREALSPRPPQYCPLFACLVE